MTLLPGTDSSDSEVRMGSGSSPEPTGGPRWAWFTALVRGPSMAPTLRGGDLVVVRRTAAARPGDVVVARFRARPDLPVVKRVARRDGDGWWLVGDNALVADDSRAYGRADVFGRVVLRYWPRPRLVRRSRGTG